MKIVLAFDSFKGSLDAPAVVAAVAKGIKRVSPEIEMIPCPVADGGEGTVSIVTEAAKGHTVTTAVHGPLNEYVTAQLGLINQAKTAIIEAAQAIGLPLIEREKRDPTLTTSYGVGELIRNALDMGAGQIIIGIGGSATTDGGTGMAQALGVHFESCDSPMTGGKLANIASIDLSALDKRIKNTSFQVAVDVSNPLLGPSGAARIFSPQKGATPAQVELLENGLRHLASLFPQVSTETAGSGAAGGLGWGLVAFLNAELKSGIDLILDLVGFENLIQGADLVITGEGSFDRQSLQGKAPIGVAKRAVAMNIPVVVLAGDHNVSPEEYGQYGIINCYSICKYFNISVEESITKAPVLLKDLAASVIPQFIQSEL